MKDSKIWEVILVILLILLLARVFDVSLDNRQTRAISTESVSQGVTP